MKKNFILMLCLILTILISNEIVYSQSYIGYWEPVASVCKNPLNYTYRLSVTDNGDL